MSHKLFCQRVHYVSSYSILVDLQWAKLSFKKPFSWRITSKIDIFLSKFDRWRSQARKPICYKLTHLHWLVDVRWPGWCCFAPLASLNKCFESSLSFQLQIHPFHKCWRIWTVRASNSIYIVWSIRWRGTRPCSCAGQSCCFQKVHRCTSRPTISCDRTP